MSGNSTTRHLEDRLGDLNEADRAANGAATMTILALVMFVAGAICLMAGGMPFAGKPVPQLLLGIFMLLAAIFYWRDYTLSTHTSKLGEVKMTTNKYMAALAGVSLCAAILAFVSLAVT